MEDTLAIREAAEALGVSVDTVRRWANAGLIKSSRTAGGHRRFSVAEIQRMIANRDRRSMQTAGLSPPSRPLPQTADVLARLGAALLARAGQRLYRDEGAGEGWFVTEPGASHAERWLLEVADAARTGDYGRAVAASRRLARHAWIAGVPAVESDSLLELLTAAVAHELSTLRSTDTAATRRLLISLRQAMLGERVSREEISA